METSHTCNGKNLFEEEVVGKVIEDHGVGGVDRVGL